MGDRQVRIEGPPEVLAALRRDLIAGVGEEVRVDALSSAVPGELREPVLVGLLLSFASTAAVAIKTVGSVVERRMTHLERRDLLRIYRERDDAEISVEELRAELWDDE